MLCPFLTWNQASFIIGPFFVLTCLFAAQVSCNLFYFLYKFENRKYKYDITYTSIRFSLQFCAIRGTDDIIRYIKPEKLSVSFCTIDRWFQSENWKLYFYHILKLQRTYLHHGIPCSCLEKWLYSMWYSYSTQKS